MINRSEKPKPCLAFAKLGRDTMNSAVRPNLVISEMAQEHYHEMNSQSENI